MKELGIFFFLVALLAFFAFATCQAATECRAKTCDRGRATFTDHGCFCLEEPK